jgi:succinate-semialdehyde dehydrogenase/glutarate-semialdehyde dehydrogenase
LSDVTPAMRCATEETFGPVVSVARFDTDDEAVERANATNFGLSASIWTRDAARARKMGARLQIGGININEGYAAAWAAVDAPIGGFKASGMGRRHGREGLFRFTESQTIAEQRLLPLAPRPGQSPASFVRQLTAMLRWMRRIPGA